MITEKDVYGQESNFNQYNMNTNQANVATRPESHSALLIKRMSDLHMRLHDIRARLITRNNSILGVLPPSPEGTNVNGSPSPSPVEPPFVDCAMLILTRLEDLASCTELELTRLEKF